MVLPESVKYTPKLRGTLSSALGESVSSGYPEADARVGGLILRLTPSPCLPAPVAAMTGWMISPLICPDTGCPDYLRPPRDLVLHIGAELLRCTGNSRQAHIGVVRFDVLKRKNARGFAVQPRN